MFLRESEGVYEFGSKRIMVKVESNGKKTFASGRPVRRSLGPLGPAHVGLPRALICNLSSYLLHFLPLLQSLLLLLLIPSPPTPVSLWIQHHRLLKRLMDVVSSATTSKLDSRTPHTNWPAVRLSPQFHRHPPFFCYPPSTSKETNTIITWVQLQWKLIATESWFKFNISSGYPDTKDLFPSFLLISELSASFLCLFPVLCLFFLPLQMLAQDWWSERKTQSRLFHHIIVGTSLWQVLILFWVL